jgi:outer membrane protein assembly factor BamD
VTRNNASRLAGALLVVALLVAGCSPMPEVGETTAEDTYETGMAAAERGDHLLAIEAFKRITLNSPLHEMADDALVGIADSHRAISDYASAELEYRQLLSDYPRSPLVPEAEYKLGVTFQEQALPAALDQTMTKQAISQFEYFLAAYPGSGLVADARVNILELKTKLAAKIYDSATLYFDLGRPKAARVYLEAVVAEYPGTSWARVAILDKARSFAAEGSGALAENEYQRLIDSYPGTEEARTAAAEKAVLSG